MNLYTFVLSSAALLIQLYSDKYRKDDLSVTLDELDGDDNLPRVRTYDFIIVGGGAAGCVLANRLSLDHTVLLLEAGGTPPPATRSSIFFNAYATHPSINYLYTSVPHQNSSLQNRGVIQSTEGKMLGGSGSHNALVYNRGSPSDFDHWAALLNDTSWNYKNTLTYFEKSLNLKSAFTPKQDGLKRGLMSVESADAPILSTWLQAGAEFGFKKSYDPSFQIESFAALFSMKKKGRRSSSYTSFIEPIEKSRENLRVERYSFVEQILIDEDRMAYGVAYSRHGIPQIAHASKEVVVSCGVNGSPMLLMKSGIGPRKALKEAGIPVIADLPVGKNLFRHLGIALQFTVNDNGTLVPDLNVDLTEDAFTDFQESGDGILAYQPDWALAYITSSKAKRDGKTDWPDLQFTLSGVVQLAKNPNTRLLIVYIDFTRPKYKGCIGFNATAYKLGLRKNEELALIDYNLWSEHGEFDVILEGIKLAYAVMENTKSFQEYNPKYVTKTYPGCSRFGTDGYWRCLLENVGPRVAHAAGTCRMGYGLNDPNAVLDSDFNVLGISKLRVVDASAMPANTNSNTCAPVIMMAERSSDAILKSWMKKKPK